MNFFGEPGRNRPPPPIIKKVMMTVPTKVSNTNRIRPTAPAQRFVSTPQKRAQPTRPQEPKDRVKRLVKRKSHTPTPVLSSDDDSGDDSSASSLNPNKRARPNAAPVDSNRKIVDLKNRSRRDQGRFKFRHGADLVAGEAGKKYLDAFDDEKAATVELQYPSDSQRERYVHGTN